MELVERESLLKPFNQVGQETGVALSTMHAIFREHGARLEQSVCFKTPPFFVDFSCQRTYLCRRSQRAEARPA